jgi:hypothetical protein
MARHLLETSDKGVVMAQVYSRTGSRDLDQALSVIEDERRIKTVGALVGVAGMLFGLCWLVWMIG